MVHGVWGWFLRLFLLDRLARFVSQTWLANKLVGYPKKLSLWWAAFPLSNFWKHVVGNVVLGLAISLFFLFFHDTAKIRQIEDESMDWMMSMLKSTAPEGPTIPLALLDIDEKTYQYWGEPFYVPRKPLVKILDYARRSQPSLIFLDVEVAHPGHTLGEDQAITDFIANYPADAPPLILVRTFRQTSAGLPQQRTSFLDPTVQDNPNVFWASTLFKQDDDFSIRRWLLWVRATNAAGDIHAIPSVQLMATVFLKASDEGIATSYLKLQQGLAGLVKKGPAEKGSFSIGGITVVSKSSISGKGYFTRSPIVLNRKDQFPWSRQPMVIEDSCF